MTVYLVGAGPGDPDLITRRGARLLAQADVVVYDRLVNRSLLDEAPDSAELIDVGKTPGRHDESAEQKLINSILIDRGRRFSTVIRLKGGDPFLFGRGGEEVEALALAGVHCVVVPGVSSSLAVPALAGVPLTHRGVSSSVTIISGHDANSSTRIKELPIDGTVVLMMAVAHRAVIASYLLDAGRSESTPVAIIESGSTQNENRISTTLARLGVTEINAPAIIVVGDVAAMMRPNVPN